MEKWHMLGTSMVCVDESTGRVVRATKADSNSGLVPAMPYKWSRWQRAWINAQGCKLSTLKSGISRGTYQIM